MSFWEGRLVRLMGCLAVVVGCATPPPAAFRALFSEGDRSYRSGRFSEAASAYERAAAEAGSARDRGDARYRAAMACRRAGDLRCAERLLAGLATDPGQWDHAPRARLEHAALRLRSGDDAQAESALRELQALIEEAPDTGPARGALRIGLRSLDARDATGTGALTWLDALAARPQVVASLLCESVLAERATRLEARGELDRAEAAWRDLMERVPYPDNSHWDDGHLALARLLRGRGRFRDAIEALEHMLSVREESWGNGSYAAPRFDDGAWMIAEVLRDDLHDRAAAADAFHRVYAEHRTSLRRDDALWEEAALRRVSDAPAACRVWRTLADEFPCRRFAARARAELVGCGVRVAEPTDCAGR